MSEAPSLSSAQVRHLRSLAHGLKPVVQLGKQGLTDAVHKQIDQALLDHELIKVKLGSESPTEMDTFRLEVGRALGAVVAQTIGHVAVLYRRHPEKPQIALPRAGKANRAKS